MGIGTDGDQVAAHYAAKYPALFMIVKSGTPNRAPVGGDVLSMAKVPGFDGADGGHTAVVQSSSVNSAGDGTVTVVEENAVPSGVQVLSVTNWNVTYDGFPYVEWLTTAGMIVTTPTLPSAQVSRPYSATLTAAGGKGADRWTVTAGSLPSGLDAVGGRGAVGDDLGRHRERRRPGQELAVHGHRDRLQGRRRDRRPAAHGQRSRPSRSTTTRPPGRSATPRGPAAGGSSAPSTDPPRRWPGHTSDVVGRASSAVVIDGGPMVFYSDSTTDSLRAAWRADGASGGWRFETLDGPSSTLAGSGPR